MWFKSCQIFQFTEPCTLTAEALEADLARKLFTPCGNTEMQSTGWVPPTNEVDDPLVYTANGFLLISLKTETKLVPSSVVKDLLAEKIEQQEAATGRKVRSKEKQQLKEEIYHSLLPRAFSRSAFVRAYIAPTEGLLIVEAASPKKAETFTEFLRKSIGSLKIRIPELQNIPTVLTHWINKERYPAEFTIEDNGVLQDPKDGGVIRCQRQNLLSHEIQSLVRGGREVSQLRLSWCDQLAFVLKEDFSICGLRFIDTGKKDEMASDKTANEADEKRAWFDADFCLMTETFRYFFEQMLKVFGKTANLEHQSDFVAKKGAVKTGAR